ncbi:hypothetical protein B3286c1_1056 [Brucella vulpis]|uniref:hypothetical protein n=1 Tax=Brucella vulpis TaxID=981386 RepID=UPI00073A8003|nr:hypothetical protein BF3285c1_1057 [Brucella vulpis]CUW49878.1 hypothetical protein B3286c1_1056 [Brucella vulpis]
MKNPSIFGSSQKRGVLIPICSRFESVTFRESEAILTLPEVCQQSEAGNFPGLFPGLSALKTPTLVILSPLSSSFDTVLRTGSG